MFVPEMIILDSDDLLQKFKNQLSLLDTDQFTFEALRNIFEMIVNYEEAPGNLLEYTDEIRAQFISHESEGDLLVTVIAVLCLGNELRNLLWHLGAYRKDHQLWYEFDDVVNNDIVLSLRPEYMLVKQETTTKK